MRRLPLALATAGALVLAACSDSNNTSIQPEESTPLLAPPTARSHGLPIVRGAHKLRIDPQQIRDRIFFNIEFRFVVPPTASAEAAFESARKRWQKIIIRDIAAIEGGVPQSLCFPGIPDFTGTIDDLLIDVLLIPIDGPGNILGAAGPCFIRTDGGLPVSGVMIFDVDDLEFLEDPRIDLLEEVVIHEMGHVLGFGTLWNQSGRTLLAGGGTPTPTFTGRLANVFWRALGGRGPLPVEGDGGPGTAFGHWDEESLVNELMTGFINLGENPLSAISAASMRDFGYGAIPRGDPYHVPDPAAVAALRTGEEGGIAIAKREQLITPKGAID